MRLLVVAAVVLGTIGLSAGGAWALLTAHSGSSVTKFQARSENAAWSAAPAASTFVDVPGAALSVVVPAGVNRMHFAEFTAESFCGGTSGWCSVRIVRVSPSGAVTELNPDSGVDFAFDSAGGDTYQAGAVQRTSFYVAPGTYTFKVQAARVSGATSIRLDDWNFSVISLAP